MYFHIDESGNTGNNLFDSTQPRLSYGVLSSVTNVDALCTSLHRQLQTMSGMPRLHANELGIGGLTQIAPVLYRIQEKMRFDFDYYFIDKPIYALVSFFEAVFDAGLNEAVKWDMYWTPLRYMLIGKLTVVFDEALLKRAWELCIDKRIEQREGEIVELLKEVEARIEASPLDPRSKEIIGDALKFGVAKPLSLDFGQRDQRIVSPNAVGFQFVVSAIARRVRNKKLKKAASIKVDRQAQFNRAQIETHQILARISKGIESLPEAQKRQYLNHPMFVTLDKADLLNKDLPERALTITNSADSIGLQICDIYLWLSQRVIDGTDLPPELVLLWDSFGRRSLIDGISLGGMETRFLNFEKRIPSVEGMSDDQREMARQNIEKHRARVKAKSLRL